MGWWLVLPHSGWLTILRLTRWVCGTCQWFSCTHPSSYTYSFLTLAKGALLVGNVAVFFLDVVYTHIYMYIYIYKRPKTYQTHHIQAEAALLVNNVAALGDDAVRVRTASHSSLIYIYV